MIDTIPLLIFIGVLLVSYILSRTVAPLCFLIVGLASIKELKEYFLFMRITFFWIDRV